MGPAGMVSLLVLPSAALISTTEAPCSALLIALTRPAAVTRVRTAQFSTTTAPLAIAARAMALAVVRAGVVAHKWFCKNK